MTNRATGWAAQKDQYAVPVMFNPYTGEPRDVRDVQSDPQGILIVPPGRVEMLAATPPAQAADSVLEDAARYRWLRHGDNDEKVLKTYTSRPSKPGEPTMFLPRNGELDRLIDAARAEYLRTVVQGEKL